MSIVGRAKAKWDALLGKAERLYGESHGDAAATVAGEALEVEAEAEEAEEDAEEARERARRRDDDGLTGAR